MLNHRDTKHTESFSVFSHILFKKKLCASVPLCSKK